MSYTRVANIRNTFSASRIDRFYVSRRLLNSIRNIEHLECFFSDNHTVQLTLEIIERRTAYSIFDCNLLKSERFIEYVHSFWDEWRQERHQFADIGEWWDIGKAHLRSSIQWYFPKRKTGFGIFDRLNQLGKMLPITQYIDIKAKVRFITDKSSIEAISQSKANHLKHGNSPTKLFFKNLKRRN